MTDPSLPDAVLAEAWAEFRYPRAALDEPTDAFRRAMRVAVRTSAPDHAASVLPEEIVQQRSLGWPDFHPETFCHRCGHRNITWYVTDKTAWEIATRERARGELEILCPSCFALLYEANGGPGVHMWELVQYDPERERRAAS